VCRGLEEKQMTKTKDDMYIPKTWVCSFCDTQNHESLKQCRECKVSKPLPVNKQRIKDVINLPTITMKRLLSYNNPDPKCQYPFTPDGLGYCWSYAHHIDGTKGFEDLSQICPGCESWNPEVKES